MFFLGFNYPQYDVKKKKKTTHNTIPSTYIFVYSNTLWFMLKFILSVVKEGEQLYAS